jgi:tetratricopeptide (TPR) repeat protein
MSARVDKQWKDKGLQGYSTEAILGTLGHYGVQLDEAGFKAAAETKYPLELAVEWKPKWKGTGQFAPYPFAAASELFSRLLPEKPSPMKTAHMVLDLIAQALREVAAKPEAEFAKSYKSWEELVPKLPPQGDRRDAFMREFVSYIESWAQTFNELPERLAKAGKKEQAIQFAQVHEVLFTDREGCMTAIVRAQTGEREAAVADLKKWSAEEGREVYKRYSALDALFQLEEWQACKDVGLGLFDAVAAESKWDLADTIAHLLGHLVKKVGGDLEFMRGVRDRLDRAHQHTGGHHH